MPYLFLISGTTLSAMVPLCGRLFRTQNASRSRVDSLYNALVPLGCFLAWLVLWLFQFSFEPSVLIYSFLYGVFYFLCNVGIMGALKHGSTSLTSLMTQVALVAVSIWSFFFWDTSLSVTVIAGIVLIVIALCLCILEPGSKDRGRGGSIGKWLFFASLAFLGNAGGNIVIKYQQLNYDNQHTAMFMVFGALFGAVVSVVPALKEDKSDWSGALRTSWYVPLLSGASTMGANGFVILSYGAGLSPTIALPVVAVGGLMITTLVSMIFFREKLRPMQWIGFAVGAVAILLLNL